MWIRNVRIVSNAYQNVGKKHEEREGFEPSVPVKVHFLSREARSTTPAPLHEFCGTNILRIDTRKKFIFTFSAF